MKNIVSALSFLAIAGTSSVAVASPYSTQKVETTQFGAQGGAGDVTEDPRNPTNMARQTHSDFGRYSPHSLQTDFVQKNKVSFGAYVLGIDARFSPSEVDNVFDAIGDAGDVLGGFGLENPLSQLYSVFRFNRDSLPLSLDANMRTDFVTFRLGTPRVGTFSFGAYSQAQAELFVGQLPQITLDDFVITGGPSWEEISEIDSIEDLQNFDYSQLQDIDGYIDLGRDYQLLKAKGYLDLGTSVGWGNVWRSRAYGRVIESGFGFNVRYFHRWRINNPQIIVDQEIRDDESVRKDGFDPQEGDGGAVDLYYNVHVLSSPLDPTFGIAIENLGATTYSSGTEPEVPRVGLGMSIRPLGGVGGKWARAWKLNGDLDNMQYLIPTVQLGTSYEIKKNSFGIVPRVGGYVMGRDLFGDVRHGVTAGGSILLKNYSLDLSYEHNSQARDTFLVGGRLKF